MSSQFKVFENSYSLRSKYLASLKSRCIKNEYLDEYSENDTIFTVPNNQRCRKKTIFGFQKSYDSKWLILQPIMK